MVSKVPVSDSRRSLSWSLHNNLLRDVESQSASGASDSGSGADLNDMATSRTVSDAGEASSKPHRCYFGGSRYVEKYLFAGLWTCLLLAGYASGRISAHLNIPPDAGTNGQDPYDTFEDISKMLQFGFLLGWFTGVFDLKRFAYLFHWRQFWWVLVYVGTPPVYSAISRLPALQHSLADVHRWGAGMYIITIIIFVVAAIVVFWHLLAAWTTHSKRGFMTYLGSRLTVQMFYLLFGLITAHYSAYNTQHIHHFYLGWSVALFAEFNHPISLATLAIAMGVFAQGVGVYGFASLFEDSSCFTATADSTQMTCDFTSTAAALTVRVCPQAASAFQHSCFYTSGF